MQHPDMLTSTNGKFSDNERAAVYRAIFERRDVRRDFLPTPIPDGVLASLLTAAHHAGSVGFMQPWDCVVRQPGTKRAVKALFHEANGEAATRYKGSQADLYRRWPIVVSAMSQTLRHGLNLKPPGGEPGFQWRNSSIMSRRAIGGTGMRITKVYTRTGDAGKTRLAGGQQVWKDCLRVEAYGTVDELNASVGVVRAMNAEAGGTRVQATQLEEELRWIQNKLFDVGGILATVPGQEFTNMPQIKEQDVVRLEKLIDRCQKDLIPLKEFILPGGGKVSGFLHQARTICRRAERVCVRLAREEPVDAVIIKFVNRLSDALFVLARWAAKTQGEPEFLWERTVRKSNG